jgi:hypothetical protein
VPAQDPLDPRNRRRSPRVKSRIAVTIRIQSAHKPSRSEKSHTMAISAHGALVLLAGAVEVNEMVVLSNGDSGEELLCRVTSLGDTFMGKTQVALEFIMPAPNFWGRAYLPKDRKPGGGAGKAR